MHACIWVVAPCIYLSPNFNLMMSLDCCMFFFYYERERWKKSARLVQMLAVVILPCPCHSVCLVVIDLDAEALKVAMRGLLHQHFNWRKCELLRGEEMRVPLALRLPITQILMYIIIWPVRTFLNHCTSGLKGKIHYKGIRRRGWGVRLAISGLLCRLSLRTIAAVPGSPKTVHGEQILNAT